VRDDVREILDWYEGWRKFPSIDAPNGRVRQFQYSLSQAFIPIHKARQVSVCAVNDSSKGTHYPMLFFPSPCIVGSSLESGLSLSGFVSGRSGVGDGVSRPTEYCPALKNANATRTKRSPSTSF